MCRDADALDTTRAGGHPRATPAPDGPHRALVTGRSAAPGRKPDGSVERATAKREVFGPKTLADSVRGTSIEEIDGVVMRASETYLKGMAVCPRRGHAPSIGSVQNRDTGAVRERAAGRWLRRDSPGKPRLCSVHEPRRHVAGPC